MKSKLLATSGGRIIAAVACLAIGLPVVFGLLKVLIPKVDKSGGYVRLDIELVEAGSNAGIPEADVRVYRKSGNIDVIEPGTAVPVIGGSAMIKLRKTIIKGRKARLHIDAPGYEPFRKNLTMVIETGEIIAGDHLVRIELTPKARD